MRNVNPAGLALIKKSEGLRLTTYLCKAGKLTIGWGHTGPEVTRGMTIPLELAERLFVADVTKHSMGLEKYLVSGTPSPNQWAAMVSLAFNMGVANIGGSTLMRLVNAGDMASFDEKGRVIGGAAAQFCRWVYLDDDPRPEVRHMVSDPGLLARRLEEQALFLMGMGARVA